MIDWSFGKEYSLFSPRDYLGDCLSGDSVLQG